MDNKKLVLLSASHSLGVLAYVSLVVTFMNNAQRLFGNDHPPMTGIVALLVFILSALITSSLVLGKPIMLYLDGKKAEAVKMVFYTGASLFVLLLLAMGGLLLLK